jgi:hypothetical protein
MDIVRMTDILLVEYEQLKKEQNTRIRTRDHLFIAMLTASAAVVATTLNAGNRPAILLLLPPIAMILGWTYLVNDEKISALGRYIRDDLALHLAEHVGAPVFGWERTHRSDERRKSRKWLQLAADLTAFCTLPTTAIVACLLASLHSIPTVLIALVELFALAVLAGQINSYATRERGDETE